MRANKLLASAALSLALLSPTKADAFTLLDFFTAIEKNDLPRVQSYVQEIEAELAGFQDYELNLNFTDIDGRTPLMEAAENGNHSMVEYLKNKGADPFFTNQYGETAISVAKQAGHESIASFLSSPGAVEIASFQAAEVAAASSSSLAVSGTSLAMYAGSVGLAAGGIAFAAGGSDSNLGGSGITAGEASCTGGGNLFNPAVCTPASLLTTEAQEMEGIDNMNAEFSLAFGYDGRIFNRAANGDLLDSNPDGNVVVAVIDSGVDVTHPDLDSNILTANAVTCTTTGCTSGSTDVSGHGTNVAGVIAAEKNDTGMHGVAPMARIMPIAAIGVAGGSDTTAFQYANNNGAQIINGSYGLGSAPNMDVPIITATKGSADPAFTPAGLRTFLTTTEGGTTILDQYTAAVAADRIVVYAAGNASMDQVGVLSGLPYYFQGADPGGITGYTTVNPTALDFSDHWVTVVSLDDSNNISTFSNECGVAANWCIAAPGEINSTTTNGGGYNSNSGTSFAAPNVSGAMAALLGAYPHLQPEAVLQILFDTATDLGAAGIDPIYGHGLVNLEDATAPTVSGWTMSVGSSSLSATVPFEISQINLSPAFGDAGRSVSNLQMIFLDAYNKDYTIDLGSRVTAKPQDISPLTSFYRFGGSEFAQQFELENEGHVAFTVADDARDSLQARSEYTSLSKSRFSIEQEQESSQKASVRYNMPYNKDMITTQFDYNVKAEETIMPLALRDNVTSEYYISGNASNPYLSLAERSNSSIIGYKSGNSELRFGYVSGQIQNGIEDSTEEDAVTTMFTELSHQSNDLAASVQLGVNIEDQTFLGTRTDGAFSIDDSTTTYYSSVGVNYGLNDDVSFNAIYNIGHTQLDVATDSLFTDFSDILTSSFSVGGEVKNLSTNNDKLGFAVSQPLRVESSTANLILPVDISSNSEVLFATHDISLAPSGREIDLEAFYQLPFENSDQVTFGGILRLEPGHDKNADPESLFLFKYSSQF